MYGINRHIKDRSVITLLKGKQRKYLELIDRTPYPIFPRRYFEAMRSEEFRDVDINLQREMFEWLHMHRSMYVACDSWYEASCRGYHEYWECPGEQFLHWKDKGYRTVFDLLQVTIYTIVELSQQTFNLSHRTKFP